MPEKLFVISDLPSDRLMTNNQVIKKKKKKKMKIKIKKKMK